MYMVGFPAVVIIRVKNNSSKFIEEVKITYDGYKFSHVLLKNIKPGNNKQIGISTINVPKKSDLKIFINKEKTHIIKENLKAKDRDTINVVINNILEDGTIEYEKNIES